MPGSMQKQSVIVVFVKFQWCSGVYRGCWQFAVRTSIINNLDVKFPVSEKFKLYTCPFSIHMFYGNLSVGWEVFSCSRKNS